MKPITPCLWFDGNAEPAVHFYSSIFKNFRITDVTRYGKAGHEIHGMKEGAVLTIAFEINGQPFTALNGGPMFKFNEAVSFQIPCENQEEIDFYWSRLAEGADARAQQCGWLKDKFGVSWQVIPSMLPELLRSNDAAVSERVMSALLKMKKLDIDTLRKARELQAV